MNKVDNWRQKLDILGFSEMIFVLNCSSEDINRQLPVESKRYQTMERIWRKILSNAKQNPQVTAFFDAFAAKL